MGLVFCALAGALLLAIWQMSREKVFRVRGMAMGTGWTLAWRGDGVEGLEGEVASVLERWEGVMSQWREGSDLSRFNRGEAATVDLARVMELAEGFREASGGAFDHRVLEKVHAAGFGPAGEGVDLSAVGKGFAVDRVGERLRELGVRDFVFELGGEVLAGDGEWPVAVEVPDVAATRVGRTVVLSGNAMATSGNYRQFSPDAGGLRSHLIDPRTGEPVVRAACSVSVIAGDCATADAWATALFVLGPEFRGYPETLRVSWQFADGRVSEGAR